MKESLQTTQKTTTQKQTNNQENPYRIFYDHYMESACSDTECTGLIPTGDSGRSAWEHYRELYHFGGYE